MDDRGVSELLGAILLIGLVITGALIVVYFGSQATQSVNEQQSSESAELNVEEVEGRLNTLASSSEATVSKFGFGDNIRGQAYLRENQGYLNVTVNKLSDCSVEESLDSVRVETDSGKVVAYEAGGTWIRDPGNGTVMRTAPTVSYRNGTLDVSLLNMTGSVDDSSNRATVNVNSSRNDTRTAGETLLQGDCVRPDNVTVRVQSDFYRAWADYLSEETDLPIGSPANPDDSYVQVDEPAGTVEVYLNQSALPWRTNDEINNVINVTGADYMDDVTISEDGISVSKNAGSAYTVYTEPIAKQTDVGTVRVVEKSQGMFRDPLDVVFVIDESGSMAFDAGGGKTRKQAVQNAMKNFTRYLNGSRDRIGLAAYNKYHNGETTYVWNDESTDLLCDVSSEYYQQYCDNQDYVIEGGNNRGKIYRTNNRMLTNDFVAFNTTTTRTKAVSGTYSTGGMKKAASMLNLLSNESRDKIVILLTDGVNTDDSENWIVDGTTYSGSNESTKILAKKLNKTGTVTHTIGFADSENEVGDDFLENTANLGGGNYYFAENKDELNDVFDDIAGNITRGDPVVNYTPLSTNISGIAPQIPGDTDHIAEDDGFLNVNDPTAPSRFSHSFAVDDGKMVNFTATQYGCEEWVGTGQTMVINGTNHPVTRCSQLNTTDKTVVEGDNVTVFTNDDSAEFSNKLDDWNTSSWQTNLTESLEEYGDVYNESTDELTLKSNQVIVAYDFPDGKNSDNIMLMLYSVGLAEEDAKPTGVIDFKITNINITN